MAWQVGYADKQARFLVEFLLQEKRAELMLAQADYAGALLAIVDMKKVGDANAQVSRTTPSFCATVCEFLWLQMLYSIFECFLLNNAPRF